MAYDELFKLQQQHGTRRVNEILLRFYKARRDTAEDDLQRATKRGDRVNMIRNLDILNVLNILVEEEQNTLDLLAEHDKTLGIDMQG